MTIKGQTFVVAGATGVIGSGVVRCALDAGATVVGISRSADKLARLRDTLRIDDGEPFHAVVGDFDSEVAAITTREAVEGVLDGRPIDHAVSAIGSVLKAQAPTATSIELVRRALEDGLVNAVLFAKQLVPLLKARAGSSFTQVSGGLAHGLPSFPGAHSLWLATLKNASVNALTHGLAAETANDAVRVNTLCIHFTVGPIGGGRNQLGMEAARDTLSLAPAFLRIAHGTSKGRVLCLHSWDDVQTVA